MARITVNIRAGDGIESSIEGIGAGRIIAEKSPRSGSPTGMGFGGGEMLCLAVGACFFNNLQREAASQGIRLESVEVEVSAEWDGSSPVAKRLQLLPHVTAQSSRREIDTLIRRAFEISSVANTIIHGAPVELAGQAAV